MLTRKGAGHRAGKNNVLRRYWWTAQGGTNMSGIASERLFWGSG